MEYDYEADMEETYRTSMFKTFKKTLDDGFFPFIILDAINDRVRHFEQFWSAAKTKGFEVMEPKKHLNLLAPICWYFWTSEYEVPPMFGKNATVINLLFLECTTAECITR